MFFKDQSKSSGKHVEVEIPENLITKKAQTDMEKLDFQKVEKGLVRLKFKHPLASSPFANVFPSLKFFKRCFNMQTKNEQTDDEIVRHEIGKGL